MKTISKVPVVHEDIAIGAGKISQQRGSESVIVQQVELAWIFRTTDEIRDLDIAKYTRVTLHQEGAAPEYWYDATSIALDNGSSILKPNSVDTSVAGRWLSLGTGSANAIPLTGTLIGAPVSGPIEFENSLGQEIYSLQADVAGPNNFGFTTKLDGANFTIATKNIDGVVEGFTFTDDGDFIIPSTSGNNQEGWQFGAASIYGDPNVLIISPIDALGNTLTNPVTIITAPDIGTVFHTDGSLTLTKSTVASDPGNSLTTKDYVDALLPPGGGEANTTSSPGVSGEELTMAKSGTDLPFKKLIAGTDITLTATVDGITIDGNTGVGGGLPAGLVNQGLRNLAGTNTYEATAGLLITDTGNVGIGPGTLAPVVPLQVEGTTLLRSGGQLNLNNPSNSSTGYLLTNSSNRLELFSPNAGGVDINGLSSTGGAVKINANGQLVFTAIGSTESWCSLHYSGDEKLKTLTNGIDITGDLTVGGISATNQVGGSSLAGGNLTNPGRILRSGAFGLIEETNYVFDDVVLTTTNQTITGIKTFTSNMAVQANLSANALSAGNLVNDGRILRAGVFGLVEETSYKMIQMVKTVDDQTIGGEKTFTANMQVNAQIGASSIAAGNLTTSGRFLHVGAFGLIEQSNYSASDLLLTNSSTQQVAGIKEFNGGLTAGNSLLSPTTANPIVSKGSIHLEGMTSATGSQVLSSFGTLVLSSSDERLKQNVAATNYGLLEIMLLRPVDFEWKDSGAIDTGFIAQDVQKIIPEAVPTNPDGMLGLRDVPIIAALVKGMQEQQGLIDELRARLDAIGA